MKYELPLADRLHFARVQRERYQRDPAFRLKQINRTRQRRGMAPVSDLSQVAARRYSA